MLKRQPVSAAFIPGDWLLCTTYKFCPYLSVTFAAACLSVLYTTHSDPELPLQINYADMLKRVDPLRNELKSLESQADENKHRAEDIIKVPSGGLGRSHG